MRIRSIHPEFWRSEDVATMAWDIAYEGPPLVRSGEWNFVAPMQWNVAYVYFLCCDTEPIYIGKAGSVLYRIEKHRRKTWWPRVNRVLLVRLIGQDRASSDRDALWFEKRAIAAHLPTANMVGPANLPAKLAMA